MKIKQATNADQNQLLGLMRESHEQATEAGIEEWTKTEAAVKTLLQDSNAGEAYIALAQDGSAVGYIIMCRGFSLDYGGYFTWVEESYMRQAEQGRFRDQRFSP